MADTIGEKIKKLRKEAGMTQTELVHGEMTKSMLSQIENNLAMPSMKNLQYLAERLGKPVSYFVDEAGAEVGEDLPIKEISSRIKEVDMMIENNEEEKAADELTAILKAYNFAGSDKVYGDILKKLGSCLNNLLRFDEADEKLMEAYNIYIGGHLYIDAAKTYLELFLHPWHGFQYEKALEIVEKAEEIYSRSISSDSFLEIEILFYKAIVYSTMDNMSKTLEAIEKALSLSNENNMYYNSDELYRLKASVYMLLNNYEEFEVNMEKASRFVDFTGNKNMRGKLLLLYTVAENKMSHPEKALEYNEEFKNYAHKDSFFYYYMEKGKALYAMGDYKNALENFLKIDFPFSADYGRHREDYLFLWTGKVYMGLVLYRLGRVDEALGCINDALEKMDAFPLSKQHAFAYKSLSEIYSKSGDFENAYKYLKMADEINEKTGSTQMSPS